MSELFEGSHVRSENGRCQKHGSGKKFGRIQDKDGTYFDAPLKTKTNPNSCFFRGETTSRLDVDGIIAKIDAEAQELKDSKQSSRFNSGPNARLRRFRKRLSR